MDPYGPWGIPPVERGSKDAARLMPPPVARRRVKAAVVGAGVVGLSSAIRLAEAGHEVRVVAERRSPRTTSDVAAAVYFPYRAYPERRVIPWARATLAAFERLAREPDTGVALVDVLEPLDAPQERPWWDGMAAWRRARADELPPRYQDGFVLRGPVVEMPRYMAYLERRAAKAGIAYEERRLRALDEAGGDVVVHCSGLGARELCGDASVTPVRGQVVKVRNPGLSRAILDEAAHHALGYVIPRSDGVVLGGTADEGAWDLAPDARVESAILAKALDMEPRLAGCEVLGRAVGLRPARPEVRLELDRSGRAPIVHNYGHGGSGVTLSWGCADEVVALVGALDR